MAEALGFSTMTTDLWARVGEAWAVLRPFALGILALGLVMTVARMFGIGRG